jgi:hypothetical protein
MDSKEAEVFRKLFRQAYQKCFSQQLSNGLTEAESKHFSNEILEQTGLVIGWKSLKNYSRYITDLQSEEEINPSIATLDTLARFVADASKTSEHDRKKANLFSYWYKYREEAQDTVLLAKETIAKKSRFLAATYFLLCLLLIGGVILSLFLITSKQPDYLEEFSNVDATFLEKQGWKIKEVEPGYWNRRGAYRDQLTFFTLAGDNYPTKTNNLGIKNLLMRKIDSDCFSIEVQFADFIPCNNWQQSGILLMEDSTYNSRSVRMSISYNDFFGGFEKSGEIIIQIIAATLSHHRKPEEIAHYLLFTKDTSTHDLIQRNLKKSALRIEKQNNSYYFSYAIGDQSIFAFKEIIRRELNFTPRFVAIFASSGEIAKPVIIPVRVESFYLSSNCR